MVWNATICKPPQYAKFILNGQPAENLFEQAIATTTPPTFSQQLALSAAGCCLLATLTLVLVAAQSTQSIQNTTLTEHAKAAAEQLAARAAAELSAGNRLGLVAELQFYTDQTLFAAARVLDVESMPSWPHEAPLADAQLTFRHPVVIDGDTAGQVELYLDLGEQKAARETLSGV